MLSKATRSNGPALSPKVAWTKTSGTDTSPTCRITTPASHDRAAPRTPLRCRAVTYYIPYTVIILRPIAAPMVRELASQEALRWLPQRCYLQIGPFGSYGIVCRRVRAVSGRRVCPCRPSILRVNAFKLTVANPASYSASSTRGFWRDVAAPRQLDPDLTHIVLLGYPSTFWQGFLATGRVRGRGRVWRKFWWHSLMTVRDHRRLLQHADVLKERGRSVLNLRSPTSKTRSSPRRPWSTQHFDR